MALTLFAGETVYADAPAAAYWKAPPYVAEVLDALPPPDVVLSPTREHLFLVQGVRYPSILEVSAPMLRLAGLRVDPLTNGRHLTSRAIGLTVMTIADRTPRPVELPADGSFGPPVVSADGRQFAVANTSPNGIELWVGDVRTAKVRKIAGLTLNGAYGPAFAWMPDQHTLLCRTIPAGRGAPPQPPLAPPGPHVQESHGQAAPIRTFQDLLHNPHDEALFDYYCTSQLSLVDSATGKVTGVGAPALFTEAEPSPDGRYLLVRRVRRPYSYLLTVTKFPHDVEVWDRAGNVVHTLARLPMQDRVPIDGEPTGPRLAAWQPTEAATLAWVEALDDGDPKRKVPHRDRLLAQAAPFAATPVEWARLEHRFMGLTWLANDGLALLRDYDRDRKWVRTFLQSFKHPQESPKLIWDRSVQDRYNDAGTPLARTLPNGQRVAWQSGTSIFLVGGGASATGDRPFLDRFDLDAKKSERLFQSAAGGYEFPLTLVSDDGSKFVSRHESATEPPNYSVRTVGSDERQPLTEFTDPTPQLRAISKRLVTYKRADGLPLSFTLYLPPDYKEGDRLPTVLWAYPQEFASADTAGQVFGSPHRFTSIGGPSHLFFCLAGYAVLDGATMPVVGPPETANDTFIDQIVSSAKAAIDKAAELGVTDPARVGVGGHSYGAFMTANLLAHCDLFKAGVARSGAYNRTLTPFGFQSERRTLWEAPEVYARLSPFNAAHKIKAPLLLIHGEADNNPGTFPVQSERMYQAVRGNGGTVRYVSLPFESHGYVARESVEHTLAEMLAWFDKYVKNAK